MKEEKKVFYTWLIRFKGSQDVVGTPHLLGLDGTPRKVIGSIPINPSSKLET